MQMKSSTKLSKDQMCAVLYEDQNKHFDTSQQRSNTNNCLQASLLQRLEIPFKCSAVLVGVEKGEERRMEKVRRGRGKMNEDSSVIFLLYWEMLGCRLTGKAETEHTHSPWCPVCDSHSSLALRASHSLL